MNSTDVVENNTKKKKEKNKCGDEIDVENYEKNCKRAICREGVVR